MEDFKSKPFFFFLKGHVVLLEVRIGKVFINIFYWISLNHMFPCQQKTVVVTGDEGERVCFCHARFISDKYLTIMSVKLLVSKEFNG